MAWFAWRAYTQPLPLPRHRLPSMCVRARRCPPSRANWAPRARCRNRWRWSRWRGVRGVDRTIKAGSYEIDAGITLPQLLAKLTSGDVTQTSLLIVEGATFGELKRLLRGNPDVKNTVLDLPDAELMARLGVPDASPEGRFFPDTYFFAAGSTDVALLNRARRAMRPAAGGGVGAPGVRTCRSRRPTRRSSSRRSWRRKRAARSIVR